MKRFVAVLATCTAIAAGVALPASPAAAVDDSCAANHFCAYENANYVTKRLDAQSGPGSTVDVADDVVSSGKNHRNNYWVGMDIRWFGDAVAFTWAPTAEVSYVGASANDIINYFKVQ